MGIVCGGISTTATTTAGAGYTCFLIVVAATAIRDVRMHSGSCWIFSLVNPTCHDRFGPLRPSTWFDLCAISTTANYFREKYRGKDVYSAFARETIAKPASRTCRIEKIRGSSALPSNTNEVVLSTFLFSSHPIHATSCFYSLLRTQSIITDDVTDGTRYILQFTTPYADIK